MLVVCPQHVTAGAQEQLEAKDRLIQKLAANNKEKDNLIAVCAPPFFFVIYPVKITKTYVKKQETNNKLCGHISTCKSGLNPSVDFFSLGDLYPPKQIIFHQKQQRSSLLFSKSNLERSRWLQRLPRDYHMLPSSGNEVV